MRPLTVSRLTKLSIKHYNDTACADTRIPTWLVVGDKQAVGRTTGLSDAALVGGDADTDDARVWLDYGTAPNGTQGGGFTDKSTHGFGLTFTAPKSVSLLRAFSDSLVEKLLISAHTKAVRAAMAYLNSTPATPGCTTRSPA